MLAALMALAVATPAAPDYAQDAAWLCRPGHADACAANQDVTVVRPDGSRTIDRFVPARAPKFDCFYVYPTVSNDPGPNSDMTAGVEETQVATVQAGRFAAQCRVFAPLYRQVTLTALRAGLMTGAPITGRELAYADVKAAWESYLARDNNGRGVILIGHSQGAGILKQLIAADVEGRPVADRMIAAYLVGTNVVDGDFKGLKPCRSSQQTGCIVTWVTFREDVPPPATARFGMTDGKRAWCTNPASLKGGFGEAKAIFNAAGASQSSPPMGPWSKDGPPVATTFVAVPGLITTICRADGTHGYLGVRVNADPRDARTDTIVGDVVVAGQVQKDWGLHLVDMPVVMGDLVELAGKQGEWWAKRR